MTLLAITNGRLIDPVTEKIVKGGILIKDRHIIAVGNIDTTKADEIMDAKGHYIAPAIVDIGVFAIDLPAFARGGITRAALMPDQSPPLDEAALVQRAAQAGKPHAWIYPLAAASRGLAGKELAEIGLMKMAGAKAVATGRQWIADSGLMYRLLNYARSLDLTVILHAEDGGLTAGCVATQGEVASHLGLQAAPAIAEAMAVARDLMLAEETGAKIHFSQLTTARSFELIRAAKKRGVKVTCGINPAYFLLSEKQIEGFRTFARLSPPLRSEEDRLASIEAVRDGTIDIFCSAHDPRGPEDKRLPFVDAQPGMAGAETLLATALTMVHQGVIDLARLANLLSGNAVKLLGCAGGRLAEGEEADLIIFDAEKSWKLDSAEMAAKAGNSPFDGETLQGQVLHTIKGGQVLL
ncbi:MAG: dihydroorotase [Zymomonas mobilis subsp. pomaceae]|uniref:Dihydroorotase, multifunctional complex type n=1 Tax=Zymomonas mobilis subsp. pomaceae (strain ATCC 29192 / DSM 22645 / JCM 10191 / CCUG 17912 / NBRC 13757 / NCIMB 11200 / NRRL B-4491 / Barker I) TaxID=579138 RepID=F8EVF6_ZYMMT|nr:dihydroorotase [Zymomonas mobilis]AEI37363.1 dihydroorotase, multifunctional complex type [Zymomonas mobilis subsp. pomaceae ATCC 29192]MDX5948731.1 dihydroorotase [Zymomonas mobilis subsp. pomaceae]GEB88536.1 dihydroorotase [Zymomonas mobilis subsp. pomaceae]